MIKRTSTSYVITLDVFSAADMDVLKTIKKVVSVMNFRNSKKKRVVLRGRKPAVKGRVSYDWAGNIVGGIKNATKIDVYIYDIYDRRA